MTGIDQPLRVLEAGAYARVAGWFLAEFGAAVIQVAERAAPPSLPGFFDRDKRRLYVDGEGAEAERLAGRLVEWASLLVVSTTEGRSRLVELLLNAARERERPVVVITPNAAAGTESRPLTDLTAWSSSGVPSVVGYPHRPPTVFGGRQSLFVTGGNAAVAALALAYADPARRSRVVEVRVQECLVVIGAEKGVPGYLDDGLPRVRTGESGQRPALGLFPAADGLVTIVTFSDVQWDALARWMASLGAEPLLQPGDLAGNPQGRYELGAVIDAWIAQATAGRGMAELTTTGQSFGVPITPVHTFRQFVEHPLFVMRDAIAVAADGRRTLRSPFRSMGLAHALGDAQAEHSALWGEAHAQS